MYAQILFPHEIEELISGTREQVLAMMETQPGVDAVDAASRVREVFATMAAQAASAAPVAPEVEVDEPGLATESVFEQSAEADGLAEDAELPEQDETELAEQDQVEPVEQDQVEPVEVEPVEVEQGTGFFQNSVEEFPDESPDTVLVVDAEGAVAADGVIAPVADEQSSLYAPVDASALLRELDEDEPVAQATPEPVAAVAPPAFVEMPYGFTPPQPRNAAEIMAAVGDLDGDREV